MSLSRWTLFLSLFLLVLGVAAWLGTGRQSVTALIPAFLGAPLLVCALASRRQGAGRAPLIIAAVLALLGLGGTASGVVKTARLLAGQPLDRPEAAVVQALVALGCLVWLLVAARHLVQYRRTRALSSTR